MMSEHEPTRRITNRKQFFGGEIYLTNKSDNTSKKRNSKISNNTTIFESS
jgi:hypothetical protein